MRYRAGSHHWRANVLPQGIHPTVAVRTTELIFLNLSPASWRAMVPPPNMMEMREVVAQKSARSGGELLRKRRDEERSARRAGLGSRGGIDPREMMLANVLAACLDAMEHGQTDLEAMLEPFPEAKHQVRPLLEIALLLRQRRGAEAVGAPA